MTHTLEPLVTTPAYVPPVQATATLPPPTPSNNPPTRAAQRRARRRRPSTTAAPRTDLPRYRTNPASRGPIADDPAAITVHDVLWEDPAGAVLRAAMAAEVRGRYADRLTDRTRLPEIVVPIDPDTVAYSGVAYSGGEAVGHLALRRHRRDVEIKRMYVVPESRGRGVASALLAAAEVAAGRLGARRLVLQTGDRQPDAVRCFLKHGYSTIPVFPPYKAMAYSQCFGKAVPGAE